MSKNLNFIACLDGQLIELEQVNDPVFSQKMMGDGFAICPTSSSIVSPVDGVITCCYPTGHAVGITTDDGIEVLVHFGINSFKLNGKGLTNYVKQDEKIKQGQLILNFDKDFFEVNNVDITTSIIFTSGQKLKLKRNNQIIKIGERDFFELVNE